MKRALIALLALLASLSAAQAQSPPFPASLPSNTVVGNLRPVAAPGQAVSLASLTAAILSAAETPVADASYSVATADRNIVYTSLTASRTVSLLPAASYLSGTRIFLWDRSGSASSTLSIVIAPAGSDTINGTASPNTAITTAYVVAVLESDGVSKWTLTYQPTNAVILNQSTPTSISVDTAINQISITDGASGGGLHALAGFQVTLSSNNVSNNAADEAILGAAALTQATTHFYQGVGVTGTCTASVSSGGTGTGVSTSAGSCFGFNTNTQMGTGATNWFNVMGGEVDVAMATGTSAYYKGGVSIVLVGNDGGVHGASFDCGICISAKGPSGTWNTPILIGNMNGGIPVNSGSTILNTTGLGSTTITAGINLTGVSFSGNAYSSSNFSVDGQGQLTAQNISVTASQFIGFTNRALWTSPADGIFVANNFAETGFTRLDLGGTTSSFPAIKRNAAAINFRLADDSADAAITASSGAFSTTLSATTSLTTPLHIGGSGTTGVQLTLQTTTGAGTTDELDINGGNNGATAFAKFTAANGIYIPITGAGLALKNNAGSPYGAVNSGASGHYTVLVAPSAATFFQARDADNGAGDANWGYLNNDTLQITNRANNSNYLHLNSTGIVMDQAANTLILKRGANGTTGTFTCTSGGSITVSNTNVAITDTISISLNTVNVLGSATPYVKAITASTSFVALCTTNDTSVYNYAIIKNAAWLLERDLTPTANDNRPAFARSIAA